MKRFWKILLVVLLLAVSTMAFTVSPVGRYQAAAPLELPDWARLLIIAGVSWLITQGIKSLTHAIPNIPDLTGLATSLTGALVVITVAFANALLTLVPPESQAIVSLVFQLLATILGTYGIAHTVKSALPAPKPNALGTP